uniref:ditrans,polycis-polyprenyl diphosphate synthase [(2E,6E)-farnesyldiphosphate specific] n=2 Tax=Leersia perrieri TaxID=77586 RepID=A0A0D9VQR3_9ORYZ
MDSKAMEAFVANEIPNQSPPHMSRPSVIVKLTLALLWFIVHLAISLFSLWSHLIYNTECYLISFGLIPKYGKFKLDRLKYLAVVVDSREAKNIAKIKQLLCWLSNIGVKYVCLYDIDGVLKKTFSPAMNGIREKNSGNCLDVGANIKALTCCHKDMTVEYISGSDGKEGIAKAASLLCKTYVNHNRGVCGDDEMVFTETDMSGALKAIGCGGPEPDLLLVYGPVRCHLGFPAWRLRYTEIMHMGPLSSMKYGAIVKAFYNFSKKYQNFAIRDHAS